jgi:glycosyltransferase involved in cell wall biosynthesis
VTDVVGHGPRRIAFVSDAVWPFNTGGKEKRLFEISRRLVADGFEVHIYTMKWWEGGRTLEQDGVRLHALCRYHPLYRGERRSTSQALLFGLATLRLLFAPFDVLDVDHMPLFPLFSARVVCSLRRKPLFGTWHEVWGREYWSAYLGPTGMLGYLTERLSLHMPDTIISNSDQTTSRLRAAGHTGRVETVPMGADLAHIDSIQPSESTTDVLFAGRLLRNKNVDLLIEAIALARSRYPSIRGTIVGEGPERPRLEQLAHRLGVTANVRFSDFFAEHDDLMGLMKSSKVFVLPSDREGFGIVVLEANACGIPVVTVRHPDNAARHLVIDGENGFLADLEPADLADKILLCMDPNSGLRPRTTMKQRFPDHDWAVVSRRIGDLYGARRSPPATSRQTQPEAGSAA